MKKVRVRIPPAPTGYAHVGTAYMALLNFAFARKHGGKIILRFEDTDTKRNVEGGEKAIIEGLSWLGLSWDEGPDKGGPNSPYRQSERLDIYEKYADKLIKEGKAYKDEGALRFKNPGEDIEWKDLVRGKVSFPGEEVKDFVMMKSNGYPTYQFAVVMDDIKMGITHVIRGEDIISSTPRQIALYNALGFELPEYAHFPTLRNMEGKKLSKRRDPVSLEHYKKEGYLPEALLNFLMLLGWSHPEEKETFDLDEFIKLFTIDRVRKAGPVFDLKKLEWMNGQYIQKLSDEEFAEKVDSFAPEQAKKEDLVKTAPLVKTRIKKLSEFEELAGPLFETPEMPGKDLLKRVDNNHLQVAVDVLQSVEDWKLDKINEALLGAVEENNLKTGKFFMSLRVAIFSNNATPPVNESIEFLGKEETLLRLNRILD